MIPGYSYAWFPTEDEMIQLAETSIGAGLTWGILINGEMKQLEEMLHRVDIILSGAPCFILWNWFQRGAVCDEFFNEATKNFYKVIEASFRTHLQLSTRISKEIKEWEEDYFRKFTNSDKMLKKIIEYDRTRYFEISNKLLKIFQRIKRGYVGPIISKYHKLGDFYVSEEDNLQHDILSRIIIEVISSIEPNKAINYLVKVDKTFHYKSTLELSHILNQELKTAGFTILEYADLHVRLNCSYDMITKAILTNKVEIVIETMQELLGWLTGSGFHNFFQIKKNINYTQFENHSDILLYGYGSTLPNCLVKETIYKLAKSLPKERILTENVEDFSEYSLSIGEVLTEFFLELENVANNVESKCPICNDTFKKIQKLGPYKSVNKNKLLMQKAVDLYGEWLFNEIQNKSTTLLKKLKNIGILDILTT